MIASEDFERIVAEVCRRLRNELVPTKRGVWMSIRNVMHELHYDTPEAARKWVARRRAEKKVAVIYRGTALLVARKDVEAALIESVPRRRNSKHRAAGL